MILYLGIRPPPNVFHYPVIATRPTHLPLPNFSFTHIIFTSRSAVEYWTHPLPQEIIAIGPETAKLLPYALLPKEATQEGLIELIRDIPGSYLLPRSSRARSVLTDFMTAHKIPYAVHDLYDTVIQAPQPIPNLEHFTEIVFTSPSTVDGFLAIYERIPTDKKLTCIGPITRAYLHKKQTECGKT